MSELAIVLNGERFEIAVGDTVLDLLKAVDRHPRTVAVEYNGEILARARYGEVVLAADDRLEIVHFVQGG